MAVLGIVILFGKVQIDADNTFIPDLCHTFNRFPIRHSSMSSGVDLPPGMNSDKTLKNIKMYFRRRHKK